MNIFACDPDPREAARGLPDKLMIKMVLESAQIACTVLRERWNATFPIQYRSTHKNHPCVRWASATHENLAWVITHGIALAGEYTRRFGKTHASLAVLLECAAYFPGGWPTCDPWRGHEPFVLCMPDEYKSDDPVYSYRRYLGAAKRALMGWREPACRPAWWPPLTQAEIDELEARYYERKR